MTRSGPLIVEPGAGFSPVYSLLDGARHSIDMTMYEFSDTAAEHDLAAAARRGVQVRVILDRRARSVNSDAYSYLRSHRVAVTWSSPDYHYTHQKSVIIDGAKAVIMTANLTLLRRLLHPRQGGRGRLRHLTREDLHRLGLPER